MSGEGSTDRHEARGPGVEAGARFEPGPLISDSGKACAACWACVRACPARAIRVLDHRSEIVPERCVKCGACVTTCGRGGHSIRDDVPAVLELLAHDRPVVVVLATEFIAAMHPMRPVEIEQALFDIGFHGVETTLLGEELIALEYERTHARASAPFVLRSTCPVAVSWVRHFHPSLVPALAPIIPPYVAQARLVRRLYGDDDVAVVYASPCYSRKDEIFDPEFAGAVDVAIDFTELKRLLASRGPRPVAGIPGRSGARGRRPAPTKEISLTDGFPRRTLAELDMTSQEVATVRGVEAIDELLGALKRGESGPEVIDMLYCDGCIDGPATGSELSVYAKRTLVALAARQAGRTPVDTRSLLTHLPAVDLVRSFSARPAITRVFAQEEIDACLAEGEFLTPDDHLDCGGCGYDTCVEHAIAILGRDSTWDMCFPLQRKLLERSHAELTESATIDALTGLWNRRAFSDRLEAEVARVARYRTQLTLLMIDLDGFKSINDVYGHTMGDAVLAHVAQVIQDSVRETDIPARYGGDEFALILPGVGKTAGYAVAEKIRAVVSSARIGVVGSEREETVSITVSVGLASGSPAVSSGIALVEAADRALYRAKAHGRDQVRIAPD